ncbi:MULTISPECIES: hypothetical protein [unclassified Roseovarius]|uniref:hypothetical protein n=1 Tax=unclassified Roseovarius TaxID=2614913 RepID=UPI00273D8B7E|nr:MULTISPECIES: hypothetical protein [unclassified Roseovarius]
MFDLLSLLQIVFFSLFLIWATKVSAQVTYDGCYDYFGVPVASVPSAVDNVAIATIQNGSPVIFYNPHVLSSFHPVTRQFWYFHECGHHALGHSFGNNPLVREKEADCWAIRTMQSMGLLNQRRMEIIQSDISQLAGDGWIYLPGPQRAISFNYC